MTVGITANLRHRSRCIPELARARVQAVGSWAHVLQLQSAAVVGVWEAICVSQEVAIVQLRPWYREFHRTDMPSSYRGRHLSEPFCDEWFHRHSRCRHGMLLASILRGPSCGLPLGRICFRRSVPGMLGDGLTSGLHEESLDILRLPLPM